MTKNKEVLEVRVAAFKRLGEMLDGKCSKHMNTCPANIINAQGLIDKTIRFYTKNDYWYCKKCNIYFGFLKSKEYLSFLYEEISCPCPCQYKTNPDIINARIFEYIEEMEEELEELCKP